MTFLVLCVLVGVLAGWYQLEIRTWVRRRYGLRLRRGKKPWE